MLKTTVFWNPLCRDLDVMEKRKMSCVCRVSSLESSVGQPVACAGPYPRAPHMSMGTEIITVPRCESVTHQCHLFSHYTALFFITFISFQPPFFFPLDLSAVSNCTMLTSISLRIRDIHFPSSQFLPRSVFLVPAFKLVRLQFIFF
jgi:hypothetical protein